MEDQPQEAIQITGLTKQYNVGENAVHALAGVDLTIFQGEFVCISGRSGSGKSTLLNLIAGLEQPTEGKIVMLGKHIERMTESQRIRFRRKNMGFVFQSYNLMPQYTTLENVALPLAIRGIPFKERAKKAMEMLELVGLSSHEKHKPTELSGGQQQRVGIARAIITRPRIVLADEPTGNLDSKTSAEVMDLLTSIFRKWNTTFLVVSHDKDVSHYTDRAIEVSDGRICKIVEGDALK
ncbi:ABC transporter ATP-binding protein [Oscillospiraceae bacterium PP1C4]